jgi:hypothetical protein
LGITLPNVFSVRLPPSPYSGCDDMRELIGTSKKAVEALLAEERRLDEMWGDIITEDDRWWTR